MREALETGRVAAVGLLGFVTQLTNLDLLLKVLIGIATLTYLCMKICDWIEIRREKKRKKDE